MPESRASMFKAGVGIKMKQLKIINTIQKGLKIKNFNNTIKKVNSQNSKILQDANIYTVKTMPLINMKNVSLSTPNKQILQNIKLKVYEAEKVAFVDPGNVGRQSILKLLLLLEKMDQNESSLFQLLGEHVDYADPKKIRENLCYLSQYPVMFSGTVRENLDPQNKYDEEEIIRTLHFLKIFQALRHFTGKEKPEEICIALSKKEGKFEVSASDLAREQEERDNELKIKKQLHNNQVIQSKKGDGARLDSNRFIRRNNRKRRIDIRRQSGLARLNKHMEVNEQKNKNKTFKRMPTEGVGPKLQHNSYTYNFDNSIDNDQNDEVNEGTPEEILEEEMQEFFHKQINNELPFSERAKRIDKRLNQFDDDYEVSLSIYI